MKKISYNFLSPIGYYCFLVELLLLPIIIIIVDYFTIISKSDDLIYIIIISIPIIVVELLSFYYLIQSKDICYDNDNIYIMISKDKYTTINNDRILYIKRRVYLFYKIEFLDRNPIFYFIGYYPSLNRPKEVDEILFYAQMKRNIKQKE